MIVAILIGRKGSKGFPKKNLYQVLGRPLSLYPMRAARDCTLIDEVYISTDDEQLMRLAKDNAVQVIKRPGELCTDSALGEDVYVHAYNFIQQQRRVAIELVVLLMCNAPTITAKTIAEGIRIMRENAGYDSCVTVSKYNMWSPPRARRITEQGLLQPFIPFELIENMPAINCDRDSQGDVWFADMGASIVRPRCLERLEQGLLPQRWMGRSIYPLKQEGGLDVDYQWQIPQVEHWLKLNGFKEKE